MFLKIENVLPSLVTARNAGKRIFKGPDSGFVDESNYHIQRRFVFVDSGKYADSSA
jgi:hypothetical protein